MTTTITISQCQMLNEPISVTPFPPERDQSRSRQSSGARIGQPGAPESRGKGPPWQTFRLSKG
jgi:hypothetical protein